jgi:hypothetical protein
VQELFGFSAKPSVAASLPMPKAPVSTTAENDSRLGVECISDAASRDASTLRKKGYMLPRRSWNVVALTWTTERGKMDWRERVADSQPQPNFVATDLPSRPIDLRFVSFLLNLSRLRERVVRTLFYHIATSTIDVLMDLMPAR